MEKEDKAEHASRNDDEEKAPAETTHEQKGTDDVEDGGEKREKEVSRKESRSDASKHSTGSAEEEILDVMVREESTDKTTKPVDRAESEHHDDNDTTKDTPSKPHDDKTENEDDSHKPDKDETTADSSAAKHQTKHDDQQEQEEEVQEEEIQTSRSASNQVHAAPPASTDSHHEEPQSDVKRSPSGSIDIPVVQLRAGEDADSPSRKNEEHKHKSTSGDRIHVFGHNHQLQRPPSSELINIPIEIEETVNQRLSSHVSSEKKEQNGLVGGGDQAEKEEDSAVNDKKKRKKIAAKTPDSPDADGDEKKKSKKGGLRGLFSCVRGKE